MRARVGDLTAEAAKKTDSHARKQVKKHVDTITLNAKRLMNMNRCVCVCCFVLLNRYWGIVTVPGSIPYGIDLGWPDPHPAP